MTDPNITQLCPLINHQIDLQENLNEHLAKAIALTTVSLNDTFMDNHISTINHYLWTLHDMINAAQKMNELTLNELLKLKRHLS